MKSGYINLDSKTFDIIENENLIAVDLELAETLSILNKKGYLVEIANKAKATRLFGMSCTIHELIEQNLLQINQETLPQIKKIINDNSTEATIIMFKQEYHFEDLPKGYKKINNALIYCLNFLKEGPTIELKTLIELDKEKEESLLNLKEWSENLPMNKN